MPTRDILERLIGYASVTRQPNTALVGYVRSLLQTAGISCRVMPSADGSRANLFATIGPVGDGGVVLSGHTDVVPVEGQTWSRDPFKLRFQNGRYYGRGTADMKGFVASAIATALKASTRQLKSPLHLALSYDEEIGCVGVRPMLESLAEGGPKPALCLIGEPTEMKIATGHKGKRAMRAVCTGREGHSALAPDALNALHLGAAFIEALRARQAELAETGMRDGGFDIPYSTLHAGKMSGGTALNIMPNRCEIEFELRNVPGEDVEAILDKLHRDAEAIVAPYKARFPEAAIEIIETNAYPGLGTPASSSVVQLLQEITGETDTRKVAFGTEGGLFAERLNIPTAICGPGSMAQGHKPDEFIAEEQLAHCDRVMERLLDRLEAGL
ncbi:acetylornithine deacetylase [Methyloligella sp. 2.7D]|uniref:acetylornithine deacetylase n=1 Tax=unclassified Methyloligella TaxID=2625955 RepID=UPI00157BF1CC|nr:acetylornithine deacetylase [Methyloligella sp. GL2]QKP76677.1 acetylornithine deacetylase [Methyloligella sp. GL2]